MKNRIKKSWFILSWFLALVLAFSLAGVVLPSTQVEAVGTTVEVGSTTLAVGGSSSVEVWVMNYPAVPPATYGLGAYDIRVGFDPAAINVTTVTGGPAPFSGPTYAKYADYVAITQFSSAWPGPGGNIKLCVISFTCLAEGETTLALTVNTLANVNGDDVTHTPVNGTITQISVGITATPTSGPRGTAVSVTGMGFAASETGIVVTWDGTTVVPAFIGAADGTWGPKTFTVPTTAALGAHTIDAQGNVTPAANVPDVPFTVSTPAIAIGPDFGSAGDTVFINGTNFAVSETNVIVKWDTTTVVTAFTANADGSWGPKTFTVPSAAGGPHAVDAQGAVTPASDVADQTFTVVPQVMIEDTTVAVGGSGSVDVWVKNYPVVPDVAEFGLGSYTINIYFDPALIQVTSISPGDTPFSAPTFNIYENYVSITQFHTSMPGPGGDIRLCDVEFDCLGEGETILELIVETLVDANGNDVLHTTANGTIMQVSYVAEASLSEIQAADAVVVLPVTIVSVKNPVTLETIPGIAIADYAASMTFNPSFMQIVGIRGGDAPFDTIPAGNIVINNTAGTASVSDDVSPTGIEPSIVIFRIVARLTGSATTIDILSVNVTEVSTPAGGTMGVLSQPMTLTFQRGDVQIPQNGVVNITDAMFGAQYVVGLRTSATIRKLNMASVKADGTAGDKKNITDCMYIAQKVVGIRDANYNLK